MFPFTRIASLVSHAIKEAPLLQGTATRPKYWRGPVTWGPRAGWAENKPRGEAA